jgi:hypothetical protein
MPCPGATKAAGWKLDYDSAWSEDVALLSSLGGRSLSASSGRTELSFYIRIGRRGSCRVLACKETSDLKRLLRRNKSGSFASGMQLYEYLRAHKGIDLTAGRAECTPPKGNTFAFYDPKNNKTIIYLCAWTRTETSVDRRTERTAMAGAQTDPDGTFEYNPPRSQQSQDGDNGWPKKRPDKSGNEQRDRGRSFFAVSLIVIAAPADCQRGTYGDGDRRKTEAGGVARKVVRNAKQTKAKVPTYR